MLTVKGTLPNGVEYDGKIHTEFELREQLVRDMVEVADDKENLEAAEKNDSFLGICIMAKRLVSVGSIPPEDITPSLLMGMLQEDFNALTEATGVLIVKRRSFRDAAGAAPEGNDSVGQGGV
jgi:hypothetical protein